MRRERLLDEIALAGAIRFTGKEGVVVTCSPCTYHTRCFSTVEFFVYMFSDSCSSCALAMELNIIYITDGRSCLYVQERDSV